MTENANETCAAEYDTEQRRDEARKSITSIIAKPNRVGRIHLTESDYVELVLPADINGVVRVVRVINASHRIVVLMDDDNNVNVGSTFRATLNRSAEMSKTQQVELA
tara:strand:- start:7750 stop:8070 length:321 start_codon:yes stop_codon:yes gene_type:complete